MTVILCIEDESDIREDIVEELQDAGYETLEAKNGIEGLEAISKYKPDLVLCDITMPEMDGFGLLEKIRSEFKEHSNLPFIFLSALADRQNMIKGRSIGADDYLTKPIDFELLLATVKARIDQMERLKTEKEKELVKLYTAISPDRAKVEKGDRASSDRDDEVVFAQDFAEIARRNSGAVVTSKFQMISLEQIKKELGDRWPELSEKIYGIADQTLRRRLMKEDIHRRHGDGYIVCFATLPEEEARFKAEAISREIEEKVLGEGIKSQYLDFQTRTTTITVSDEDINDSDDLLSLVTDRLEQALEKLEQKRNLSWKEILDESRVIPQKVVGRGKGPVPIMVACFDDRTRDMIERYKRLSKNQSVIESEIDILEMIRVVELITDTISANEMKFVTGVDYTTLTNKRLYEKYLGICKKIDPTIRKFLIPRIRNIPQDASSSMISEIAMNLHSLFPLHIIQIDQPSLGSIDLLASQIRIISMDYKKYQTYVCNVGNMSSLIRKIHTNKARFFIENVPGDSCVKELFESGVDFVSLKEDSD